MKMISWLQVLFVAVVVLHTENLFARTVYVTDMQQITLRTGPSTEHRILKMLSTGDMLTVLEESGGWLRVQSSDGTNGWVLQRFTISEPPSRLQLERLRLEYDRLREGSGGAFDRIEELEAANRELEESLAATADRYQTLEHQHAALRTEAANVVELRSQYDAALQHLEDAETTVRALTADNQELRESERLRWFLYGGGVVFAAWLIGFITGRMQRRRRPGLQY